MSDLGKSALRAEIESTLNKWSAENGSNTPDFVLSDYLMGCLAAFDRAVVAREKWYGRDVEQREPEVWGTESGETYVIAGVHVDDAEAVRLVRKHQREAEGIDEDDPDWSGEPSVRRVWFTWASPDGEDDRRWQECKAGDLGAWAATEVSW